MMVDSFLVRSSAIRSVEEALASKRSAAARSEVTTSDRAPICPVRNRILNFVRRTTGGVVSEAAAMLSGAPCVRTS